MMIPRVAAVRLAAVLALLAACAGREAHGGQIRITVSNEQASGGFYFTPLWMGLHDGTFDSFNPGAPAVPAFPFIEPLAELGDTGAITSAFASSNPGGLQGTLLSGGAPPFGPGESAAMDFHVTDPMAQRYLSFGAMIVPSNDLFFGNDDPMAYELFDADGKFNGPMTILILGGDVYDAGTEANDPLDGAAFVDGVDAMLGTSTSDPITRFLLLPGASADLAALTGLTTANGDTISLPFNADTVIASISIQSVPEPSSVLLVSMGAGAVGVAGLVRRRRHRAAPGA